MRWAPKVENFIRRVNGICQKQMLLMIKDPCSFISGVDDLTVCIVVSRVTMVTELTYLTWASACM